MLKKEAVAVADAAASTASSSTAGSMSFQRFIGGKSGADALAWLLHPVSVEDFFRDYWEQKPLLIKRSDKSKSHYDYADFLTKGAVEGQLRSAAGLRHGVDLNVARYTLGEMGPAKAAPEDLNAAIAEAVAGAK